jgi:hypothetical protein
MEMPHCVRNPFHMNPNRMEHILMWNIPRLPSRNCRSSLMGWNTHLKALYTLKIFGWRKPIKKESAPCDTASHFH